MDKNNAFICPYCKSEMAEGFIPFNTPFKLKWKNINNNENKVLVSDSVKFMKTNKISDVFFCEKCKIMIKHLKI